MSGSTAAIRPRLIATSSRPRWPAAGIDDLAALDQQVKAHGFGSWCARPAPDNGARGPSGACAVSAPEGRLQGPDRAGSGALADASDQLDRQPFRAFPLLDPRARRCRP